GHRARLPRRRRGAGVDSTARAPRWRRVTVLLVFALSVILGLLLAEARLSRIHEHRLRADGATTPPGDVYKVMAVLYPVAFLLMGAEGVLTPHLGMPAERRLGLFVSGLVLFLASKALKYWAIRALANRWTFRVM